MLMAVTGDFLMVGSGGQASFLIFANLFATFEADSDHERLLKEMARMHNDYIKMV